jgi:hypothetical protein
MHLDDLLEKVERSARRQRLSMRRGRRLEHLLETGEESKGF